MLPIGLMPRTPLAGRSTPFLWVPWLLLASIGPLFLVVSAQAPLMQRWFAMIGRRAILTRSTPRPISAASRA